MTTDALATLLSSRTQAASQLANHILGQLQTHFLKCAEADQMQPFTLKLNTNADDDTVTEALKECARWTDRHGNALTSEYVWFDTDQPDIIHHIEGLAGVGLGAAFIGTAAAIAPILWPVALLSTAFDLALFGQQPNRERFIMFAPSAIRAHLRMPMRVYNVAGGYISVATTTAAGFATQAGNLTGTALGRARQGLAYATGLFRGKTP